MVYHKWIVEQLSNQMLSENFCNFRKPTHPTIRPHFMPRLARCVEVREQAGSELFSQVTKLILSLLMCANKCDTTNASVKMCAVILIFKHLLCLPPLYGSWLFTPPSSVAVQNNHKHFRFPAWLDNTSYKLPLFQHNPSLTRLKILTDISLTLS